MQTCILKSLWKTLPPFCKYLSEGVSHQIVNTKVDSKIWTRACLFGCILVGFFHQIVNHVISQKHVDIPNRYSFIGRWFLGFGINGGYRTWQKWSSLFNTYTSTRFSFDWTGIHYHHSRPHCRHYHHH